ncbi:MAG: trypsin-like peptidase domain-containing protein [Bacteroidetes bacterium]|nr:trypsin-like peptidase domain-containing protein [Bacteroidota bacterium]
METMHQKQKSSGTGFAISSNGLIATCNHVVENSDQIVVRGINNDFDKSYRAKVIARDKNNDLAIIQIEDTLFKTLGIIPFLLTDKTIEVGSSIFVLGYPMRSSMGDEIKLTNGIISSQSGFRGDITAYQISAPVQPGNSGGPLFDDNGNIVGIINAKKFSSRKRRLCNKNKLLKKSFGDTFTLSKTSKHKYFNFKIVA